MNMHNTIKPPYNYTYGTWAVSTEDDEAGSRMQDLGTYTGHIDEIALALADKVFYSLHFKVGEMVNTKQPKASRVHVVLDIGSGMWDLSPQLRALTIATMFRENNRTAIVREGQYYASVIVESPNAKQVEKGIAREKALAKLSPADRKLLGLE